MKRISVTGWVPKNEKENTILKYCDLESKLIRERIKECLFQKKSDSEVPTKRVRVTVEVDVEVLE